MSAEALITGLKAHRIGNAWMARCPVHRDRTPSLSFSTTSGGKVLVHCFAGCAQEDVIAQLRRDGLWTSRFGHLSQEAIPRGGEAPPAQISTGRPNGLPIWRAAESCLGTPVQTYLNNRGLSLSPPDALRHHPRLTHPSGSSWPSMVALVSRGTDGTPIGIHRTFLARDGSGKAPVRPAKMMLGSCRGGAVRLANANELVMVGEGIETCLAAMQATGDPAWAALSTSGLRALELPDSIRDVVVLADGDEAGDSAARAAARRWARESRKVRIARPPAGCDFNDLLHQPCHDMGAA